jgi:Putative restriction endonuclease
LSVGGLKLYDGIWGDRGEQFEDYRRSAALEAYVLISQNRLNVKIYRRNASGRWELEAYHAGDQVKLLSVGLGFVIEVLCEDVVLPRRMMAEAGED